MKFKLNPENLTTALNKINLTSNSPIEILNGVKIKSNGKKELKLTVTNLDIIIDTTLNADIEQEGEIIVLLSTLKEIVSKLNKTDCSFEIIKNKLQIKQNKIKFNIDLFNHEEYPELKTKDWGKSIGSFDNKFLKDVSFASRNSISSGRVELYSIYFDKDKLVATDGFTLGIRKINKLNNSFLLSYPVAEMLQNISGEFDIFLSNNQVKFSNKEFNIISSLIDGEYPDYKSIITKNSFNVVINKNNLIQALERTKISNSDSVNVLITKKNLKIKGESEKVFYEEELEIDFNNKELELRFNPNYLLNILQVLPDKKVTLEVENSDKPIIIKNKGMLYLFLGMEV
jgi:DNA polymerase-3 subunit beta